MECSGGRVELLDKVIEDSKGRKDRGFELSVLQDAAVSLSCNREWLLFSEHKTYAVIKPREPMDDRSYIRTTTVKLDRGLRCIALFECPRLCGRGFGGVEVVDLGYVVQLHDLARDDGFEGVVGVWERGEGVLWGRCEGLLPEPGRRDRS